MFYPLHKPHTLAIIWGRLHHTVKGGKDLSIYFLQGDVASFDVFSGKTKFLESSILTSLETNLTAVKT